MCNYMEKFPECVNMWEYELFRDNQKSESSNKQDFNLGLSVKPQC